MDNSLYLFIYLFFFAYFRAEQPIIFKLHLRQLLSNNITRCKGNCGKRIDQKDTMLRESSATTRWFDKKTA